MKPLGIADSLTTEGHHIINFPTTEKTRKFIPLLSDGRSTQHLPPIHSLAQPAIGLRKPFQFKITVLDHQLAKKEPFRAIAGSHSPKQAKVMNSSGSEILGNCPGPK